MKAVIDGYVRNIPDHSRQPGRLLIGTLQSSRSLHGETPVQLAKFVYQLASARRHESLGMLRYDGAGMLWRKAVHMLRREVSAGTAPRCASFVGTVLEDRSDGGHSPGDLIAGISPTHPPDTSQVIARPEHIFRISAEIDLTLAACVLYGGMSAYAVREAERRAGENIGVSGAGVLASFASMILTARGRRFFKPIADRQRTAAREDSSQAGEFPRVWIETGGSDTIRPDSVRTVIGVEVSERRLTRLWPSAREHVSISTADFGRIRNDVCDLYYNDGPPVFPAWCTPDVFEEYLELVAEGRIAADDIRSQLGLRDVSANSTDVRLPRDGKGIRDTVAIRVTKFAPDGAGPISRSHRPPARRAVRIKKKVSLVGTGRWGIGMVARQIIKDERIVVRGLCDRRPEALHLAQRALSFEYATTSYDEVLDDPDTDMVLVTPYHNVHAEFATRALLAGKHCYVEKPPVTDWEELDNLCNAAEQTKRMLYVGYNRRYAPATRLLINRLAVLDGPIAFDATIRPMNIPDYKNWILWPSNGGSRIVSNLCHMLDLAMYLTGDSRPLTVAVAPARQGRPEDNLGVMVRFENDSIASILFTSRGYERKGSYNEIYQVMKGNLHATIDNFESLSIEQSGERVNGWKGVRDKGHRAQMAAIAGALVHDGPAPFPVSTVRSSASMYLAVLESVKRGGSTEPVDCRPDLVGAR